MHEPNSKDSVLSSVNELKLISIHHVEAHGQQQGWSSMTEQYCNIKWWQTHRTYSSRWHEPTAWDRAFQENTLTATQRLHNPSEKPRISMRSRKANDSLCSKELRHGVDRNISQINCRWWTAGTVLLQHPNSESYPTCLVTTVISLKTFSNLSRIKTCLCNTIPAGLRTMTHKHFSYT